MPKTQFGYYSLRLLVAFVCCLLIAQFAVMSGQRGGNTFFDNLWISVPMLLAFLSVIAAAMVGAISLIRYNERSPLVFLVVGLGLLVLIFLLGEFLFPH
jgi:cytochrome bd-type quinol oxidase subunit 2